jgi:hypothetical protein
MVVFVEQDTDVASQMAHQFFNDTTADGSVAESARPLTVAKRPEIKA